MKYLVIMVQESNYKQKQLPRGALKKRYSENMQQIYGRTPTLKCDFTLRYGCSPVNLLHIFNTLFPKNNSGGLLLYKCTSLQTLCIELFEAINYRQKQPSRGLPLHAANSQESTHAKVSLH